MRGNASFCKKRAKYGGMDADPSTALACPAFGDSETCYRYDPKLRAKNEEIADLLFGPTDARKTGGVGLCLLHLRNLQGRSWNHKRVYRIYCELELNLRPLMVCRKTIAGQQIYPRKRLRRDNPDPRAVSDAPNMTFLSRRQSCAAGQQVKGLHGRPAGGWSGVPAVDRTG